MKLSLVSQLAALTLLLCGLAQSQGLQFVREDLGFRLLPLKDAGAEASLLVLDGIYTFRGSFAERALRVHYPFPLDSCSGTWDALSFRALPSGEELGWEQVDDGMVAFSLPQSLAQEQMVAVHYEQEMYHGCARYILTSTQTWGKPLEEARFVLEADPALVVDSLGQPPSGCQQSEAGTVCHWSFEDFLPDQDLLIWYHVDK